MNKSKKRRLEKAAAKVKGPDPSLVLLWSTFKHKGATRSERRGHGR